MTIHSSARSIPSSHQNVLATGPATCAQAASLASTASWANSIASARESVVVCTCTNCASPDAITAPLCSPAIPEDSTPGLSCPQRSRPEEAWVDRRLCLIVNPQAGSGRARTLAAAAAAELTAAGTEHRVVESNSLKHAAELTAEAAGRDEVVVAVGGDGMAGALAGA